MRKKFRKKVLRFSNPYLTNTKFWVWGVILFSILFCSVILFLQFRQNRIIHQTTTLLDDFRQTRIDLAKGFLYISLADDGTQPFDKDQGVTLLEQSVTSMEEVIRNLNDTDFLSIDPDELLITNFKNSVYEFRLQLAEWNEYSPPDPFHQVKLRITYMNLETQASQIDRLIQSRMNDLSREMDSVVSATLLVSGSVLVIICVIVYLAGRAKDKTDQALQENEARLRSILNYIPDLVWLKDTQGKYIGGNFPFLNFIGCTIEDLPFLTDADVWTEAQMKRHVQDDASVIASGNAKIITEILTNHKGESFWFEIIRAPVSYANGTVLGTVSISRNIQDRKRIEDEIKELNADLEKRVAERTTQLELMNQELETFSFSVSHDLRAPLRGIDGLSHLILEENENRLEPDTLQYINRILEEIQHMERLIDGLLTLSRVSRWELHQDRVDLSNIAVSISQSLQETYPESEVTWKIESGMEVLGDYRLLEIALTNLMSNAFKFSGKQTNPVIQVGKNQSTFFVKDNGVGFDSNQAASLFAPFQRLENAAGYPGNGIGLATVKRIIQRHGGKIWVEAQLNQGATFYFTLNNE